MAKTIQFITKGKTDQVSTVSTGAGRAGAPLVIKAQKGLSYELKDNETYYAPQQIFMKRRGKDLLIKIDVSEDGADLNSPADIIIKGYYDAKGQIIGLGENGEYYNMVPQSANSELMPSQMADGQSAYGSLGYTQDHIEEAGVVWWPYLLGALAIGGIAAAVAGSGGGDDNNPAGLTARLDPNSDSGTKGDNLTNDTTPTIIGTGEPDSTIQVAIDGKPPVSTTVDSNGNWSLTSSALTDGSHTFIITQTTPDDETSTKQLLITIDSQGPLDAASVMIAIDTNNDGYVSLSEQGAADTTSVLIGIPDSAQTGDVYVVTNDLTGDTLATYSVGSNATAGETMTITNVALPSTLQTLTISTSSYDRAGNNGPSSADSVMLNQAPITAAATNTLLNLIGLEALGLIDISEQAVAAYDVNNNIQSISIKYGALIDLTTYELSLSQAMANELGLQIGVINEPGLLGIIAASTTLVVTALDGGSIDNGVINELLSTLSFASPTLDVGLLTNLTITATDSEGLSSEASAYDLANVGALATQQTDSHVQEGTSNADTLTGTINADTGAQNADRLYGYGGDDRLEGLGGSDILRGGEGNDILIGGDGDDLLDGGAGVDQLNGNAGNDRLAFDAQDSLIDGGADIDILYVKGDNASIDLTTLGDSVLQRVEIIDLSNEGNNTLTLAYSDLLALNNDVDQLFVLGDNGDQVDLNNAELIGTQSVDNVIFNVYDIGGTSAGDIWVQQDITVI